jgi:hypothetical protein
VTKDPKNPHRVRITWREESEHEIVKRVAETKLAPRSRILRDDLYPIRVDNVRRIAVLDERNGVRAEITEMLGRENDTEVAKMAWLSKRDVPKAYGSMVTYLKKNGQKLGNLLMKDSLWLEENPALRRRLNVMTAPSSVTIANRSRTTKPTNTTDHRFVVDARKKAITTVHAQERFRNVSHAAAPRAIQQKLSEALPIAA